MTTTTKVPARNATKLTHRLLIARELGILLALVLLIGLTTVVNPRFLSAQGIKDLLLGATVLTVLAVGQTIVVITRNVDLSVGSVLGLSAFATGSLLAASPGIPAPAAFLIGTALGALCGLVNGAIIAAARVPALVVTLGTLYIYRGLDHTWAGGRQINAADLPRGFLDLGTKTVIGIPVLALIAVVVLLIVGDYLRSYRGGRELYALGSAPDAARLAGIPTGRRVLAAFTASGALAGLAGALHVARFGTLDANAGLGIELNVVAAVVVGGVAIFGGSGSVYGAAIGAVLLTTIGAALPALGVSPFWQRATVGALILAAIGLDRALSARLGKRLRAARRGGAGVG